MTAVVFSLFFSTLLFCLFLYLLIIVFSVNLKLNVFTAF